MIHHFGILEPPRREPAGNGQRAYFGEPSETDSERPTRLERDLAILRLGDGFAPEESERPRFVRMVMPPYF
ncbi:hypothetical protein [Devosia sp. DBB001]|nr:hypothetical protein [Devosia sp. DBB001]